MHDDVINFHTSMTYLLNKRQCAILHSGYTDCFENIVLACWSGLIAKMFIWVVIGACLIPVIMVLVLVGFYFMYIGGHGGVVEVSVRISHSDEPDVEKGNAHVRVPVRHVVVIQPAGNTELGKVAVMDGDELSLPAVENGTGGKEEQKI